VAVSVSTAFLLSVLSASAVALVQAQRAARSAERERVVKEFVADVFRINSRVNPVNAALRPASPVSLLEGGAQLIQQRFAGQPDMQAELFAVVGGVFSDMGAYKLAADYSTHRIEALNLSHADNIEQAKALLVLAQALYQGGKYADAEVRLRRVMELAKDDMPVRLDALVVLARLFIGQERLQEAEQVVKELESQVKVGVTAPIVQAWTLFNRAVLLDSQNHFDQSLPLLKQAITQALNAEGSLSLSAVDMRLHAAGMLRQKFNFKLAREYFDAADKALRELGGAHELRADYRSALFAYFLFGYSAISGTEATNEMLKYRARLVANSGPIRRHWAAAVRVQLQHLQEGVRWGRQREGIAAGPRLGFDGCRAS
jgi:tetratricopeptide (TPR) repeat protein